jgi:hypothetical protein
MEKEEEILARKQEMGFIADLDKGNGVTEGQFILAALEHLGTLNFEKDVKPSQEVYIQNHFLLTVYEPYFRLLYDYIYRSFVSWISKG